MLFGSPYPNKYLTITQVDGISGYIWKVDGQFRTVTNDLPVDKDGNAISLDIKYRIENINGRSAFSDCVGCSVYITAPGAETHIEIANPSVSISGVEGSIIPLDIINLPANYKSIELPSIEDSTDYPLFGEWIKSDENALLNTTSLEGTCNNLTNIHIPLPYEDNEAPGQTLSGVFPSIFGRSLDGIVFLYDRHLSLYENTVENPLPDGGGSIVMATHGTPEGESVKCHNVKRNFLNEDHCKLSYLSTACEAYTEPKEVIILNDANIEGIRTMTGKDLYVVTGLTLSDVYNIGTKYDAPCYDSNRIQLSSWMKVDDPACDNVANIGNNTLKIYQDFVDTLHLDYVKDNVIDAWRDHQVCDEADEGKTYLGKVKASDGTCFQHVHRSELEVIDITGLNETLYTISGNTVSFASMDIWYNDIEPNYMTFGKLGDHVDIVNPPNPLRYPLKDQAVQDAFKTLEYNPQGKPKLVCGSPQEIASDPFYGDNGFDVVVPESSLRSRSNWELAGQKNTVWTELALNAKDQLRMKMAWSLSQIVSVGLSTSLKDSETEGWLAFYDILVKRGLSNYREMMREYSFSVIMGYWLSFEDNRSLQYNIDRDGLESYPDENYAREIMQLFSIGLHQLNMDGSIIYQENGSPESSYSLDDIVSYSRAWTGFVESPERGGAATTESSKDSTVDPMTIDINKRDLFPKTNLLGGFIVSLCQYHIGMSIHLSSLIPSCLCLLFTIG